MPISQLQLPGPLVVPQLDWSGLNTIGDAFMARNERERQKAEFAKVVDTFGGDETPAMQRAPQPPGGPVNAAPGAPANAPGGYEFLDKIATDNGLNPRAFRRYVQLESSFNPVLRKGKYTGLLQLDPEDFAARGGKNIEDAFENATIGAQKLRENADAFKKKYNRDPNDTELYLSHQQGMGGLDAHLAAPERPAWQSMLATREAADRAKKGGIDKAEKWARDAIWGNVPDQIKERFGSVDNVTSGDFLKLWQGKVEGGGPQPQQQPQSSAGRGLRLNNPGNIPDGPLAKALPGYKGGQDGLAVFESSDNGLGAMDALLVSYGRRGMKSARDVASKWSQDPDQVERYASYIGNGNPDAQVDLSNPDQRRDVVQRMVRFENGGAQNASRITPDMAKKMKALFDVGTPQSQAAAYALLNKFIGKQDPIHLKENEQLLDPNTYKVLAEGPKKQMDVRGDLVDAKGNVIHSRVQPQQDKAKTTRELIEERAAIAETRKMDPNDPATHKFILTGQYDIKPDAGEKLEDQVAARKKIAADLQMDPQSPATQSYIATGKHAGDEKLGATSQKMIKDAEDHNVNLQEMVRQLEEAKELNSQIFTGLTSRPRMWLGTKAPDKMVPDVIADPKGAQATERWLSIMEPGALQIMTDTLKGATTDFELREFKRQLADPTTTEKTRGAVIDKMLRLAQGQFDVNQKRMDQLRGGTYYKPAGGQSAGRTTPSPPPQLGTPEFNALPPGELYTAPDGSVRTKR